MTEGFRILKEASCLTLSGRSTLTYQVGEEGSVLQFRLTANSGGGHFGKEWIPLHAVLDLLGEGKEPFGWDALHPMFKGKSTNNQGFLLAVLVSEGLVRPSEGSPGRYELADAEGFRTRMKALQEEKPKPSKKGAKKALESAPEAPEPA